jgi:hypothetical protein
MGWDQQDINKTINALERIADNLEKILVELRS